MSLKKPEEYAKAIEYPISLPQITPDGRPCANDQYVIDFVNKQVTALISRVQRDAVEACKEIIDEGIPMGCDARGYYAGLE